jgi:hypothetical protein
MKNALLGVLALAATTNLTFAQDASGQQEAVTLQTGEELGLIRHTVLHVGDNVEGNCWTNSDSIRAKVYLIFEKAGILVIDYEPAFYNFMTVRTRLEAFGFRTSTGTCAVSAAFNVQAPVHPTIGGYQGKPEFLTGYTAELFDRQSIFTSGTKVNAQLSDYFEGMASEFAAKIIASKRSRNIEKYFSTYPPSDEMPMSDKEFDEYIEKLMSEREQ